MARKDRSTTEQPAGSPRIEEEDRVDGNPVEDWESDDITDVLDFLQMADAGIGGDGMPDEAVSGRCRIIDVVKYAVRQLARAPRGQS